MGSASAANVDTVSILPILLSTSGSHCPVMEALTRCKGLRSDCLARGHRFRNISLKQAGWRSDSVGKDTGHQA